MSLSIGSRLEGGLLRCAVPQLCWRRGRIRVDTRKPRQPQWAKLKLLTYCRPQFPTLHEFYPLENGCYNVFKPQHDKVTNPLEVLLGRELFEQCDAAQAVLLFHRNIGSTADIHKAWQTSKRNGCLYARDFNNTIASHAFQGTRFESVLQLCRGHTALITVSDADRLQRLLRDLRKRSPFLVLIGGVIEYRFMTAADIQAYCNVPDLHAVRAQTVALLSTPTSTTSSLLTHHQGALVRLLAARADSLKYAAS